MARPIAVTVAGILLSLTSTADAQDRRGPRGPEIGIVVAESFYGHGSISAPVRRNSKGRLEVGLRGGTWLECAFSCSDTLRRQTVDFWENHGGRPGDTGDGVGYLRFRF
jgi:hypothetical protein